MKWLRLVLVVLALGLVVPTTAYGQEVPDTVVPAPPRCTAFLLNLNDTPIEFVYRVEEFGIMSQIPGVVNPESHFDIRTPCPRGPLDVAVRIPPGLSGAFENGEREHMFSTTFYSPEKSVWTDHIFIILR